MPFHESGEFAHERTVLDVLDQRWAMWIRIDGRREQQLQQALLQRIVAEPYGMRWRIRPP